MSNLNVCLKNVVITKEGILPIENLRTKHKEVLGLSKTGKLEWGVIKVLDKEKKMECINLYTKFFRGDYSFKTKLFANNNFIEVKDIVDLFSNDNKIRFEKTIFPKDLTKYTMKKGLEKGILFGLLFFKIYDNGNEYIIMLPNSGLYLRGVIKRLRIWNNRILKNRANTYLLLPRSMFSEVINDFKNNCYNYEYYEGFHFLLGSIFRSPHFRLYREYEMLLNFMCFNLLFSNEFALSADLVLSPVTYLFEENDKSEPFIKLKGFVKEKKTFLEVEIKEKNWHPLINYIPIC